MQTAVDAFKAIEEKAATSKPSLRNIAKMTIGQVIRQGDLYVEKVKAAHLHGEKVAARQLAIGNTQGSRHVAEGEVSVFEPSDSKNVLLGPVVKAETRWTLTHPEHGHFSLPAGVYQVRYQRDYASERAEELRRVQD